MPFYLNLCVLLRYDFIVTYLAVLFLIYWFRTIFQPEERVLSAEVKRSADRFTRGAAFGLEEQASPLRSVAGECGLRNSECGITRMTPKLR